MNMDKKGEAKMKILCPECKGRGSVWLDYGYAAFTQECKKCGGDGEIRK